MIIDPKLNKGLNRLWFFFPLQLVFLQLRKNHLLLIFWIILFAYVTQNLGVKYGIHHLFLYPEYRGGVDFVSHLIIGFGCGVFMMSYNISSYILNSFRFPFIATLNKPFIKYCLNNTIIPGSFFITYVIMMWAFQHTSDLSGWEVFKNIFGFVLGNAAFVVVSLLYFFFTNTSLYKELGGQTTEQKPEADKGPMQDVFHKKVPWYKMFNNKYEWRVGSYVAGPLKIKIARSSKHYDKATLHKIYTQHSSNASIFQICVIIILLLFGINRENPYFEIPAGASVFLLLSIFIMLFSAIYSWLKQWSVIFLVIIMLIINQMSKFDNNYYKSEVYGLDYSMPAINVTDEALIKRYENQANFEQDYQHGLQILENWRAKFPDEVKPKLVFINCSGGGLRSSLWSALALRGCDKISDGKLIDHSIMVTGASGGMVGAAYLRELYRKYPHQSKTIDSLINNLSKDLLNPVTMNLAMYDLFFRFQKLEYKGKKYSKDRGYAFEQQLHENTDSLLKKTLGSYYDEEYAAKIPSIIFSPTIVDDGKRLLISSQPISQLTQYDVSMTKLRMFRLPEALEFSRMFKDYGAKDLPISTALRMSSTFPYILPATSLPTSPSLEIMDAGIRDNYGARISLSYISIYADWINKNTSGVIIIQTRDIPKQFHGVDDQKGGIFDQLKSPLGSFYQNWPKIQDFDQDQMIEVVARSLKVPTDVVQLELQHTKKNYISLSWHLTKQESQAIRASLLTPQFRENAQRVKVLLEQHN